MRIVIGWKYSDKIKKWVMYVYKDNNCIALLLRPDEESCRQWAEKNLPLYQQGKMPQYG